MIDQNFKRYWEVHKGAKLLYNKKYQLENKDKIAERKRIYNTENKEKRQKYVIDNEAKIKKRGNKIFRCECGCDVKWGVKSTHINSKKHIKLLNEIIV